MRYDPSQAPHPDDWLRLDEDERVGMVAAYHKRIRAKLPDRQLHAMIHVVVENQLAERTKVVGETLERLIDEGLNRHDAIHAIGSVMAEHMWRLVREGASEPDPHERYFRGLKSLAASKWLERASLTDD